MSIKIIRQSGLLTPLEELLKLEQERILEAFKESKQNSDMFIAENELGEYADEVLPKQTELCIALVAEAFDKLSCSLRVEAGQALTRVPHLPKQKMFVNYIYEKLLCREARIVEYHDSQMIRTAIPLPL